MVKNTVDTQHWEKNMISESDFENLRLLQESSSFSNTTVYNSGINRYIKTDDTKINQEIGDIERYLDNDNSSDYNKTINQREIKEEIFGFALEN